MSGLSSKDIEVVNRAIVELYSTESGDEFPGKIHTAIRMSISGEIIFTDWINPLTSVSLACQYSPPGHISPEVNALLQVLLPTQLPGWMKAGEDPVSISDSISKSKWFQRDILWAVRSTVAQEEPMWFDVQLSKALVLMVGVIRSRFGSYKGEDRLKFQILGPHIRQVYRRLIAQSQSAAMREKTRRMDKMKISSNKQKWNWSESARKILKDYGVIVVDDLVPDVVGDWFHAQRRALEAPSEVALGVKPLSLKRDNRTLTFYLMTSQETGFYWLLLEEKEVMNVVNELFPGLDLSLRESEVLFWISKGKSNGEIAIILGISPGTVGRHLENFFPKLGVENRFAAGLMAASILRSTEQRAVFG